MGIRFLKGGLFTTIQDMGRIGYQSSGFHVSGAMDKEAFRIANILLDNAANDAMLEFAIMGPQVQFTSDTVIAITGGDFVPKINGEPVAMYEAISVQKEDILEFGFVKDGNWGYVAFASGLDVPVMMGSRSTDIKSKLGGLEGRKIQDGDELSFCEETVSLPDMETRKWQKTEYKKEITEIRVVLGPQDDHFTEEGIKTFLSETYVTTLECDRMGYRLDGPFIEHNELGADIISDGIVMGSVQVSAQGKPIIMMADCQTTGGYTKIATVIKVDLPKVAQCGAGSKIRFVAVSVEEAQQLSKEVQQKLASISEKINSKQQEKKETGIWAKIRKIFSNK